MREEAGSLVSNCEFEGHTGREEEKRETPLQFCLWLAKAGKSKNENLVSARDRTGDLARVKRT